MLWGRGTLWCVGKIMDDIVLSIMLFLNRNWITLYVSMREDNNWLQNNVDLPQAKGKRMEIQHHPQSFGLHNQKAPSRYNLSALNSGSWTRTLLELAKPDTTGIVVESVSYGHADLIRYNKCFVSRRNYSLKILNFAPHRSSSRYGHDNLFYAGVFHFKRLEMQIK